MKPKYSLIIPTLNEEININILLSKLNEFRKAFDEKIEIIVVDGRSKDKTKEICSNFDVKFIETNPGRGIQFAKGEENSNGEILIFLHADTELKENIFKIIDKKFTEDIQLASFRLEFDSNKMLYKVYSFVTKYDSIFSTFGDQGIIVRKKFYNEIGGIKKLKIMEDVDFFRRARRLTKIEKFNYYITTSSRKFENEGIIKTQIKNFILIIGYLIGISTDKIYELYYNTNKKSTNSILKISTIGSSKNKIGFNNE